MTLLFLYNAEVRYALQLRHLSSKIQSGNVTRKSRIMWCLFNTNPRLLWLSRFYDLMLVGGESERTPYWKHGIPRYQLLPLVLMNNRVRPSRRYQKFAVSLFYPFLRHCRLSTLANIWILPAGAGNIGNCHSEKTTVEWGEEVIIFNVTLSCSQ